MRVLLVMPVLTGAGAERQIAYLAAALLERGHDALIGYVLEGSGAAPPLPTHRFPPRGPWNPLLIADIARLIRTWRPDIVMTCLMRMDVAGGLAALLTGTPFVLREANVAESYHGFRAWLRKVVGRAADGIVANSNAGAAYWGRGVVIRNGSAGFQPAGPPASSRRGALYAGRLVPEKNVDILLRAVARIPGLPLTICGDGAERPRLEALAHTLGIAARVDFLGFVEPVPTADFALLLSDFEGHPNFVAECFTAGIPMILSDIAAHREIATDAEALFVPPRDVEATAAAIRMLLADPEATRERAKRAQERAAAWSIETMADAYGKTFQNLLARPR